MWKSRFYWVGSSVDDLRSESAQVWKHCVFYVAHLEEGVYVPHAFEKRSRKTPVSEIEARARLREALATKRKVR